MLDLFLGLHTGQRRHIKNNKNNVKGYVHPSYGTAREKPACWILGFGKLDNELTPKKPSKFRPRTGHEGSEGEQRYNSTRSLTSTLDGGEWLRPRPGRFNPEKRPGTHCIGGWVGPQGRSGRVWKISPPLGFDPRTVQPVAGRYIDCAIPTNEKIIQLIKIFLYLQNMICFLI